jgi:hypothetical protein
MSLTFNAGVVGGSRLRNLWARGKPRRSRRERGVARPLYGITLAQRNANNAKPKKKLHFASSGGKIHTAFLGYLRQPPARHPAGSSSGATG